MSTDRERTIPPAVSIGAGKKVYTIRNSPFEVDDRYDVKHALGFGAYGVVVAARDTVSGIDVAIKKLGAIFNDTVDGKRMLREVILLRYLDHKNILSIISIIRPREGPARFQDLYLVTELCETDLHKVIRSKQPLTEEHIQNVLQQTLLAVKHMHRANVIHRDLKPANILMNSNCDVKLCDFGLSRGGVPLTPDLVDLTEYVVTRWYRPPELLLASSYNHSADMWSLGLIAAEIACRKPLFNGKDYLNQIELITAVLGNPRDLSWVTNGDALKYIAEQAVHEPVPWKEQLRGSSRSLIDFVSKLVVWDPRKRMTVDEALQHPYLDHLYIPEEDVETRRPEPDWSFDRKDVREKDLRELFWKQVLAFSGQEQKSPALPAFIPAVQPSLPSFRKMI